ncbi:UvrABC system protein A [Rickettsiales endosymbiont of Paramecium tredecaurelia]|uniref:excinuclease ABC subunit UvrA n=1 Tax=Candidatus Sarmatiella mevalonica TaxID=2770581 RepID=UPI00192200C2|nr:excinuclease ABC subunit UvrA [Candidatus Sarmatiella mevalonica]MBL3285202.1 UvrABC system protein A [Candidatus Sarmatiella mevalonica]
MKSKELSSINIKGAAEHNLKSFDISIPKDRLVVITGLSGSGKSSLAFDTIYAEGQRRYLESLSSYARQFLPLHNKPKVDSISGLSPAISIDQKTTSRNPRSTVGTVTEIYDYTRLLFARVGVPYSPVTGLPIKSQSASEMTKIICDLPQDTKIYLLAPICQGAKGEFKKELQELRKSNFYRVIIDDELTDIESAAPVLDKNRKHTIYALVDRIKISQTENSRVSEACETAIKLSGGLVAVQIHELSEGYDGTLKQKEILLFSEKYSCPVSGFQLSELEPRIFSFNTPFGACKSCDGLGISAFFSPDLIIDYDLSIDQGAIKPWSNLQSKMFSEALKATLALYDVTLETVFKDMPIDAQNAILWGSKQDVCFDYYVGAKMERIKQPFIGIIPALEKQHELVAQNSKDPLNAYLAEQECKTCNGYRLKADSLCVKVNDVNIGQLSSMSLISIFHWCDDLKMYLSEKDLVIAKPILHEIQARIQFLIDLGLGYLTMSRSANTLSGGESQRIRLASQIGSGLNGVLYVLDEPSIGLHARDSHKLIDALIKLRDLGNTIIVVEHDEDTMMAADHIIDIGPGAGIHGGQLVAQGTIDEIKNNTNSLTGQYLSYAKAIPINEQTRNPTGYIGLYGACGNNLQKVDIQIPLGLFTCVTGVSGSGKSTLIIHTLYKALQKNLFPASKIVPAPFDKIEGDEKIDNIIDINQSPIGRTPRSNPVTYTGAFDHIRDWFAGLKESRARGYKASRFSFNMKGGRCEACQGDGLLKIEMHFLPDVYVKCDVCDGKRYNKETLEVRYHDKNIYDVLEMTVDTAIDFFGTIPSILEKLEKLQEVGLGYIKLSQPANTLSGGEAQRIKLAKELSKKTKGNSIYILDEPTTGLHMHDVHKLLLILDQLVQRGHTVVVIEHNLHVALYADYVIDIGPDGGDKGGEVVACGHWSHVVNATSSITGYYLKKMMEMRVKYCVNA